MTDSIQPKTNERIDYFDVAKGIAILCMIAGHMNNATANSFVFTFHVPLFFLISGYFLSEKRSVAETAKRRFVQLMVPYAVTSVLITFGKLAEAFLRGKAGSMRAAFRVVARWTIAALYGSGNVLDQLPAFVKKNIGAIWFLPALFLATLIVRYFMQYAYGIIGILLLACIGYATTDILWLPMSVQSAMFAAPFVYLGLQAQKTDFLHKKIPLVILAGMAGVWLFCIRTGGTFYVVRNYAGHGLIDILGALSGSYFVIRFSRWLEKRLRVAASFLKFCGRNSLILLCAHCWELKVLRISSWKCFAQIGALAGSSYGHIFAFWSTMLVKLLFCIAAVFLVNAVKKAASRLDGSRSEAAGGDNMWKRINESGKTIFVAAGLLFAVMLLFNVLTLKICDDYIYAFSFATGERIQSVAQIFPSMANHYYTMNGRLLTHALVQLMLMLPGVVFDLLNAGMFCGMLVLIYYHTCFRISKKHNALLFLTTAALVWRVTPVFGHVFLWLDGAVNYLWPMTLALLYLLPVLWESEGRPCLKTRAGQLLYVLLGAPIGAMSETISMGVLIVSFFSVLLQRFYRKAPVRVWRIGALLACAAGYIMMIRSPGTWKNRITGGGGFGQRLLDVLERYVSRLNWLIVLWLVLFAAALYFNRRHAAVIRSVVFMLVSVALNFMHIVANRYPLRGMLGTTIFLFMADMSLLAMFWESRYEVLVSITAALCMYFAAVSFFPGAYDILQTYHALRARENYIIESREKGDLDLKISVFDTQTEYSAAHDLRYLKKKTANDWPNLYMARYYGLNSLVGTKESTKK